jgi:hypothetical protein
MAPAVETVKSGNEILIRCTVCGNILDRVLFSDWLKDQAFPRTMHRLAVRHQASCPCEKRDRKPDAPLGLELVNGARVNGSMDKD